MNENNWYFYYEKKDKNSSSTTKKRSNRKAKGGTWHSNAPKKSVFDQHNTNIGFKRTLDFMEGATSSQTLTSWKMVEYYLPETNDTQVLLILIIYFSNYSY